MRDLTTKYYSNRIPPTLLTGSATGRGALHLSDTTAGQHNIQPARTLAIAENVATARLQI